MCSRKYDSNQKLLGFKGLFYILLNIPKEDKDFDTCDSAFSALFEELPRRLSFEEMQPLTELLLNSHTGKKYDPH